MLFGSKPRRSLIPASEAVAAYTGDSADELFDAAAQAAAQGYAVLAISLH